MIQGDRGTAFPPEERKINDETNAANIGNWHSEHAKKLTLINCQYKSSFLLKKKKSLCIFQNESVPENHEVPCRFCC